MRSVSLTFAKAHLSALVAAGEPICITRRGKPFARLVAAAGPRRRIDPAAFRAITEAAPVQHEGAGEFLRRMRDAERC